MSSSSRAHLGRKAKQSVQYNQQDLWQPDMVTGDPIFRKINMLNNQRFKGKLFAKIDHIIMTALFMKKRFAKHGKQPGRWNNVVPATSSSGTAGTGRLDDKDYMIRLARLATDWNELTHPSAESKPLVELVEDGVDAFFEHNLLGAETPLKRQIVYK
ncbi:unnamed protein product [Peniophora sp. CBMAI 1063]|nr:unnamed protein product [Peniophora sp. CBMAI 1063]